MIRPEGLNLVQSSSLSADGLSVAPPKEGAADLGTYDFGDIDAPPELVKPLVAGFGRQSGGGGEWRSVETLRVAEGVLRRLVREIRTANPDVDTIDDFTLEVWEGWCEAALGGRFPSRPAVALAQSLLQKVGGLPANVAAAVAPADARTAATLPEPGWSQPSPLGADGLSVTPAGIGAEDFGTHDLSDLEAPPELVKPLVAGLARKTGPSGGWQSVRTVERGVSHLRNLITYILAAHPGVATIEDLTAEVWWGWMSAVLDRSARSTSALSMMQSLLREVEGLPATTLLATASRFPAQPRRLYNAHSNEELKMIRAAAWGVVDRALARIGKNLEALALYWSGEEPEGGLRVRAAGRSWSIGEWLDHLIRNGKPVPNPMFSPRKRRNLRTALGLTAHRSYKQALFLSQGEIYALMVLFVCESGYNLSTLNNFKSNNFRADDRESDLPVHLVTHDKPRRGARQRHSWEALFGRRGALLEVAEFLTQPARDTLAALGYPTDELFVACALAGKSAHPTHLFLTEWDDTFEARMMWLEIVERNGDGSKLPKLSLQHLRLTDQVIHKMRRENTQRSHLDTYRRNDPQTIEASRDLVATRQTAAFDAAWEYVSKMRVIGRSEAAAARVDPTALAKELGGSEERARQVLDGKRDNVVVACIDSRDSPYGQPGQPCPVSYMTCFFCKNAVATPEHLPKLVVFRDELRASTRGLPIEHWQREYADIFAVLADVLDDLTPEEIEAARASCTESEQKLIKKLIRGSAEIW